MTSNTRRKITSENRILDVVNDALIYQRNLCDGKAIPLLILDTENFPEVAKSIELHQGVNEGAITFVWGMSTDKRYILLLVNSISPVEISYVIKFDLYTQCSVIDKILSSQLMYIQAGKKGDRLLNTPNQPKLLLEVPNTGFEKEWKKIYRKTQEKRFKKLGVKKKDLDRVIESFNNEWDSVTNKHFK